MLYVSKQYKILIIGAGSIGTRHLRNCLALGYNNIAITDPDEKRGKAIYDEFHIPVYRYLKEAFSKTEPSIVFVCSPTKFHILHAREALLHNTHLFIEKPLSHTLENVDDLIKETKRKKKIAMVACNWQFHSGYQEFAKILKSKKYGNIREAEVVVAYYLPDARQGVDYKKTYAASEEGGGVILDSGSHVVNYLLPILGPIKKVLPLVLNDERMLGIASEESATLFFQHENGEISKATMDYISKKAQHTFRIKTNKTFLTLDLRNNIIMNEQSGEVLYEGEKDINHMFIEELKHFFSSVQHNEKPRQSLEEARCVIEILLEAKEYLR